MEGTIHENERFPSVGVILIEGEGGVCEVQIPASFTATNNPPSAEEATEVQYRTGALLEAQVSPEFVEV